MSVSVSDVHASITATILLEAIPAAVIPAIPNVEQDVN